MTTDFSVTPTGNNYLIQPSHHRAEVWLLTYAREYLCGHDSVMVDSAVYRDLREYAALDDMQL